MSGVRVNAEAGNSLDSFISKFRNANNAIWAIFCRSIGLKKFQNAVIQNNDIVLERAATEHDCLMFMIGSYCK